MTRPHPAAAQIVRLYSDRALDWIEDRGVALFRSSAGFDEEVWLNRFTRDFRPGARILDLGCGSGWPIGAAPIDAGLSVIGRDASPGLIDHARHTLPSGDWVVQDMRRSLPAGPFDGVLAWHSLFLPHPGRTTLHSAQARGPRR